jgi:hypothetical protein
MGAPLFVQLSAEDERTGELLRPADCGSTVAKLMEFLDMQVAAAEKLDPSAMKLQ